MAHDGRSELLRRWQQVTTQEYYSNSLNLFDYQHFLAEFMPNGDGIDAVLDPVLRGQVIKPRLLRVYGRACGMPPMITEEVALTFAQKHIEIVSLIGANMKISELQELNSSTIKFEVIRSPAPPTRPTDFDCDIADILHDFFDDLPKVNSWALFLSEPIYTSLTNDYNVVDYVLSPLIDNSPPGLSDAFAPYFELWYHRCEMSILDASNIALYVPK